MGLLGNCTVCTWFPVKRKRPSQDASICCTHWKVRNSFTAYSSIAWTCLSSPVHTVVSMQGEFMLFVICWHAFWISETCFSSQTKGKSKHKKLSLKPEYLKLLIFPSHWHEVSGEGVGPFWHPFWEKLAGNGDCPILLSFTKFPYNWLWSRDTIIPRADMLKFVIWMKSKARPHKSSRLVHSWTSKRLNARRTCDLQSSYSSKQWSMRSKM